MRPLPHFVSEMTNGGENQILFKKIAHIVIVYSGYRSCTHTYMFMWVGLTSTPRLLSSKQNCHVVRPGELTLSSIMMVLNSPHSGAP
jgi:hypothetical protein